jgi:hypothetical protein
MTDVPIKPAILTLLRQTREQERALTNELTESERTAEGRLERWSIKDLIAHMAAWKQLHYYRS